MKHLGDISKINGAQIEPVDLITFGSPCQDLSVAGKRAGMKHEANGDGETTRSGLFMEAVRIIKEMREATNGKYPRFALWENVPGAFSSNKGEDFRSVLEELIQVSEPGAVMPEVPKKGWAYADSYVGDGWSIAYRVFDAQFWGVPQRRRRIYLVADFRGQCAREILFERQGLRGHLTESPPPRERITVYVEDGAGTADREGEKGVRCLNPWDSQTIRQYDADGVFPGLSATLNSVDKHGVAYGIGNGQSNQSLMTEQVGALNCMHDQQAIVFDKEVYNSGIHGTGGHYIAEGGPAPTLRGTGHPPGISVSYPEEIYEFIAEHNAEAKHQQDVLQTAEGVARTLAVGTHGAASHLTKTVIRTEDRYIVRRLTPTECARLQGFPDTWGHLEKKEELSEAEYRFWLNVRNTHAAINGKPVKEHTKAQMLTWYNKLHTDSAEYKMWGNGIALPTALYCMQGIAEAMKEEQA